MSGAEDAKSEFETAPPQTASSAANASSLPIAAALISEIPKPRDWAVFQRYCVVLFQCELNDPNTMEYGRPGQKQNGIDILGKRERDPSRYAGIQCRHVVQPLTFDEILADCRAALNIKAELAEIIFATTAPDDTHATDAAVAVERLLAREGRNLSVVVYGWSALQNKIALHPRAHQVFHPGAYLARDVTLSDGSVQAIAAQIAALSGKADVNASVAYVSDGPTPDLAAEDPVLHARIDALAELIKQDQPKLSEQGLLKLLESDALTNKPAARYRVIANLGTVALNLGREEEAARRFEEAYALRPTDARAISFLSLARTLQRRFDEAMQLAQTALDATPPAEHAIGYLLQAAARSDWQGDPETLVPEHLQSSKHAALGLAEFWRRRDIDNWEERVIALAKAHPDVDEIRNVADIATLSLALGGSDIIGMGGGVSAEDINAAAERAKARAETLMHIGFADQHDLAAHLNNAGVLLRLADRDKDCAALLERGLQHLTGQPALARLQALSLAALGQRREALAVLTSQGPDRKNTLLSIEIRASEGDVAGAIAEALALPPSDDPAIERSRWRIVGELGEKAKDVLAAEAAVAGLRQSDEADPHADIAEARRRRLAGDDEEQVHESLRAAAAKLGPDSDLATRFVVAEAMGEADLDSEAADLLEGYVNLDRLGAATMLYLESLAGARRDVAFKQAILRASDAVQNHTAILRLRAAHAWNSGDLRTCRLCIDAILAKTPDAPWARLMRMDLCAREDRMGELLKELEEPVESLAWRNSNDRMRVALLLAHMGFSERAAALAYRVFLENRDLSRAWMTLSSVVLQEGFDGGADRLWLMETVGENCAVEIAYDDGGQEFFILEPDAELRKFDPQSWEPNHPLAQAALSLKEGDPIADAKGRTGKVVQVRHKYVARLHLVMEEHEKRFPGINGFQQIRVAPGEPDGLEELKERLRAIREFSEQQVQLWKTSALPLGWLADRLGTDEIDLAAGLAGDGVKLKVAVGAHDERAATASAIKANARNGCVLDLLAFWSAWRLKSLDAVEAVCGPISVAQSTLDRLRLRAEKLEFHAANGPVRTAGLVEGNIAISETSADVVLDLADDLKRAIAWLEARDAAKPVAVGDNIDSDIRDLVRGGRAHLFDSAVLTHNLGVLLVSDDLPTRFFARETMDVPGAWSDQVLRQAAETGAVEYSTYVRWAAQLIGAGHDYVGTTGMALAQALKLDVQADGKVGYNFRTMAATLGGARAEPDSHVRAALEGLVRLWRDDALFAVRESATGYLLERLISERPDYKEILSTVYGRLAGFEAIRAYIIGWVRGHFLFGADPR